MAGNSSEESMDEEPPPEHAVPWQHDPNLPVGPPQMVVKNEGNVLTHTIYVWYIYPHLVDFHGKCR